MNNYSMDKLRNVVLLGHGGSGKTTIVEAMAHVAGMIKRQGKIEDKNTISDFDTEEVKRGFSIHTSVVPIEWNKHKINVLDTPGYFDFIGETKEAVSVADGAIIVVSAKSGVEVGTEKAWDYVEDAKIPKMIFVNGMDDISANYVKVLEELKQKFGKVIAPFQIPVKEDNQYKGFINVVKMKGRRFVKDHVEECEIPDNMDDIIDPVREMILEAVAETDEILMEKYFNEEPFTLEEIQHALHNGIASGDIVPVLCGSALNNVGIQVLLNSTIKYLPSPTELHEKIDLSNTDSDLKEIKCDSNEPFSALVFKTIVDPYVGKLSLFRVYSGVLKSNDAVMNSRNKKIGRLSHIYSVRGKEQTEVEEIKTGDIGAVAKLSDTSTGDTLCDKSKCIKIPFIKLPESLMIMAIEPKSKDDEEKISLGLHRLMEEDPTIKIEIDNKIHQQLLYGMGDQHLDIIISELRNKFNVEVNLIEPKVAYRETIRKKVKVQGKHKKQSGGHGQYGDVHIEFEPSGDTEKPYVFEEKIFGGAVPKNYFPAVEKGLQDSINHGILAGYPVVGIKATLVDGSYHPVDSSEMAFKIATTIAFKEGMKKANPILLEPIVSVNVIIPDNYMGDIMGDLNKRRGRVLGMNPLNGKQEIVAEVPMSEMFTYATDLRSMTQGRGIFTMKFNRYEEVPHDLQERIIQEHCKAV